MPPTDAYYKLRHTIDEVNALLALYPNSTTTRLSPELGTNCNYFHHLGNVCFSSGQMGWSFTLESFAAIYAKTYNSTFNHKQLAERLWGDIYYNPNDRKFSRKPIEGVSVERKFSSSNVCSEALSILSWNLYINSMHKLLGKSNPSCNGFIISSYY